MMGAKAAPDGVAAGMIFVVGERGAAVVLWWCLYWFILEICLFEWKCWYEMLLKEEKVKDQLYR